MTSPTETLHRRVRLMRERELIRAWEYRQRNYSKGVWHRLRRVLVDASEAWALDEHDTGRLAAGGMVELAVGTELHPPKRIFFVSPEKLVEAPSRRSIPLRLTGELLAARNLALVAFGGSRDAPEGEDPTRRPDSEDGNGSA